MDFHSRPPNGALLSEGVRGVHRPGFFPLGPVWALGQTWDGIGGTRRSQGKNSRSIRSVKLRPYEEHVFFDHQWPRPSSELDT